jgi:hypothetical protein
VGVGLLDKMQKLSKAWMELSSSLAMLMTNAAQLVTRTLV